MRRATGPRERLVAYLGAGLDAALAGHLSPPQLSGPEIPPACLERVAALHADLVRPLVEAQAVRDESGNVLRDIDLSFRVRFPEGADGDAARAILPRALAASHDRTCTVSRTIEAGVPVTVRVE